MWRGTKPATPPSVNFAGFPGPNERQRHQRHHAAGARLLRRPGHGAGDRFAAAADRRRPQCQRRRHLDRGHRLSAGARLGATGDRSDRRPFRQISLRRHCRRRIDRNGGGLRAGALAADAGGGAARLRARHRLDHSVRVRLHRRCDPLRAPPAGARHFPVGADPRAIVRPGRRRRARRLFRLAQRVLHSGRTARGRHARAVLPALAQSDHARQPFVGAAWPRLRRRLYRRAALALGAHSDRHRLRRGHRCCSAPSPMSAPICICASASASRWSACSSAPSRSAD